MLLRQAGIEPRTLAPDVDEDAVIAEVEAAEGRRARRGRARAAARAPQGGGCRRPRWLGDDPGFDGIVIGGDSMFEIDGEILGKPHTAEAATRRWRAMRGRTGVLHSGHSVIRVRPGCGAA